jgi:hypothetical protein
MERFDMSNTVKDKECDYGIYANDKGLPDAGRRCNKTATETVSLSNGDPVAVCKEHYNKINS